MLYLWAGSSAGEEACGSDVRRAWQIQVDAAGGALLLGWASSGLMVCVHVPNDVHAEALVSGEKELGDRAARAGVVAQGICKPGQTGAPPLPSHSWVAGVGGGHPASPQRGACHGCH